MYSLSLSTGKAVRVAGVDRASEEYEKKREERKARPGEVSRNRHLCNEIN